MTIHVDMCKDRTSRFYGAGVKLQSATCSIGQCRISDDRTAVELDAPDDFQGAVAIHIQADDRQTHVACVMVDTIIAG